MFDEYAFLMARTNEMNEEVRAIRLRRERRRRRTRHHKAAVVTQGRVAR